MTPSDFPRVLVVTSNNFNLMTGGGITLTNLFRGWPADRIANLHEDPVPVDYTVCQNFYRLSEEEINWAWPFSLIRGYYRRATATRGKYRSASGGTSAVSVGTRPRDKIWVRLAGRALGGNVPRTVKVTERLGQWLERFNPQILYGFLGSMAQIRLIREIAQRLRIPVAVHIMDDWPAVIYRRGLLGPLLRRIVQREFDAVLRLASLHFGICEDMCTEYRRRYAYTFLPFHNVLDMDEWRPHAKRDWKAESPFIVRYVGSILPNAQREALGDVCEAVTSMRSSGASLEMWVHAPKNQVSYIQGCALPLDGLHFVDLPPPETIGRLLSESDLLVLPFNFDPSSIQYVRLSMPTKVPAYMASGTPILVYGPREMATVRYAEREGWGYVVATSGTASLRKAIGWLMNDQATRERLGRRAQFLACEDYDASKIRPTFHAILASAVAKSRIPDDDLNR